MQQLNVDWSRVRLYVYELRNRPPRGSASEPSTIAVRARARPVDTSSSTCVNSGFWYANRAVVRPAAEIVFAGTNTARPSSSSSVNAFVTRRAYEALAFHVTGARKSAPIRLM